LHGNRYKWNVRDDDDDDDDYDDNDDDYDDDEDETNHNSANFKATTFRFCMVIDINEMYRMMMKIKLISFGKPVADYGLSH